MVKSFRGKEVDMVSLAKKNEKAVALGNAHMNGRGDILGKGGKIIKTREELINESKIATFSQVATINLKNDNTEDIVDSLNEEKGVKIAIPSKTNKIKKTKNESIDTENKETENKEE